MVSCRDRTDQQSSVKIITSALGFGDFVTEEGKVLMRQGRAPALQ